MTIGLRMASEKRNRRLPATCYRYVTAIFFFGGITEASPAPSEENSIIEAYVELGRYGPYGYGPTTSIALNNPPMMPPLKINPPLVIIDPPE